MRKPFIAFLMLTVIVLGATFGAAALELVSFNSPVRRGEVAALQVRGIANTEYTISVKYRTVYSKAKGLEPRVANSQGLLIWKWKVGIKTTPGKWSVIILGPDGEKLELELVVKE